MIQRWTSNVWVDVSVVCRERKMQGFVWLSEKFRSIYDSTIMRFRAAASGKHGVWAGSH